MSGVIGPLRTLPVSLKMLFTVFLLVMGIGYLMSVFLLFLLDINPNRKMGLSTVDGVVKKYYGDRKSSRLESTLQGSMQEFISEPESQAIRAWVAAGAKEETYQTVEPILKKDCVICHNPHSGQSPMLTSYDEVKTWIEVDVGHSIRGLAKVTHVHLFGIAFVFFLTGLIFSLTDLRESIKTVVICTPFAAMLLDIGSWWLTKFEAYFAYTVIAGGALMSIAVPIQVLLPIYQMWFKSADTPPEASGLESEFEKE